MPTATSRPRAAARRAPARAGAGAGPAAYSVDAVLFTVVDGDLGVALVRATPGPGGERPRERWTLPFAAGAPDEPLQAAAAAVAEEVLGGPPAWMEQVGAFGDGRRHPAPAPLSVAYVGLVPDGFELPGDEGGAEFHALASLPAVPPRQKAMIDAAAAHVRGRVGQAPVAFRLLPPTFTLSELQVIYELLLGRRLHKASFRRSLQSARIVEPTEVWRSEGRGRPAQLFRHALKRKRPAARGLRFD